MPFVITLEKEAGDLQLFSIGIDDVTRECDRLAIVLVESDGTEAAIICALEDGTYGPELRIDRQRSDPEFIADLDDSIREELGINEPDKPNVYVVADTLTDSTNLMLTVPPTVMIEIGGECAFNEYEADDGDTIRIESRTID